MEKTWILTAHEEEYSDKSRTIGILSNVNEDGDRIDSFPYIYRESVPSGMYIFFNTIMDMLDYLLYSNKRVQRAYIKENDFDDLYDAKLEGPFKNYLEWVSE